MTALALIEPPSASADGLLVWFDEVLNGLGAAVADGAKNSDAYRIDWIALIEKIRAACAALQAAESVRFAQSQAEQQMVQGVHPKAIGRGIADQIALACHISPSAGSRRLTTAGVVV